MIQRQVLNAAINSLKVHGTLADDEKVCGCVSCKEVSYG